MLSNVSIAKTLEETAAYLPDASSQGDKFTLKIDNLTIRCKNNKLALLAVAKKFRKGLPAGGWTRPSRPSIRRPKYKVDILERFVREGESDNAVAYAGLYDVPVYYSAKGLILVKLSHLKKSTDFVVARIYDNGVLCPWNVYYLRTGESVSSLADSKTASVLKFETIPKNKLNQAIENSKNKPVRNVYYDS